MTEHSKPAAQDRRKTPMPEMPQSHQQICAELLAEQARLVARLGEITALLSSGNLPVPQKTTDPESILPSDFDRKAYAIGLIWRNPAISTRELARQVGVARSTLSLPSWSDVAAVLRARRNLSPSDYKDHHIDNEDENEQDH